MKSNSKNVAISIHDIRLSEVEHGLAILNFFQSEIQLPFTIHLVVDSDLNQPNDLLNQILNLVQLKQAEVVFHGVRHQCSTETKKWASFYHNYEAEFLENNDALLQNAFSTFHQLVEKSSKNLGVCPPCWLMSTHNYNEIRKIKPLYIERMFVIESQHSTQISPVISIGAPNLDNVKYLKFIGDLVFGITHLKPFQNVRLAYHVSDFRDTSVVHYLTEKINRFKIRGFNFTLQSALCGA